MKNLFVLIIFIFLSNIVYANTYAVKFDKSLIFDDSFVKISQISIYPDEIWKIVGSCESALSYSTVKISQTVIFADYTIKISQSSLFPDKKICIKNPNSLPSWFLKIINN